MGLFCWLFDHRWQDGLQLTHEKTVRKVDVDICLHCNKLRIVDDE